MSVAGRRGSSRPYAAPSAGPWQEPGDGSNSQGGEEIFSELRWRKQLLLPLGRVPEFDICIHPGDNDFVFDAGELAQALADQDAALPIGLQVFGGAEQRPAQLRCTFVNQGQSADPGRHIFPFVERHQHEAATGGVARHDQAGHEPVPEFGRNREPPFTVQTVTELTEKHSFLSSCPLRIPFEPGRIEHFASTDAPGNFDRYFGVNRLDERSTRNISSGVGRMLHFLPYSPIAKTIAQNLF